MEMNRIWAVPSSETFSIPPIGAFVKKYLRGSGVSIDPFARDCGWATYTNDLNPATLAQYHMDALEFLEMLRIRGVKPDLIIFDPPYSRRQVKEVYEGVGRSYGVEDSKYHSVNWRRERNVIMQMLEVGGVVLSFGWNSSGMGRYRGFEIVEILLVCHGGSHNDTICMAERKIGHQFRMF